MSSKRELLKFRAIEEIKVRSHTLYEAIEENIAQFELYNRKFEANRRIIEKAQARAKVLGPRLVKLRKEKQKFSDGIEKLEKALKKNERFNIREIFPEYNFLYMANKIEKIFDLEGIEYENLIFLDTNAIFLDQANILFASLKTLNDSMVPIFNQYFNYRYLVNLVEKLYFFGDSIRDNKTYLIEYDMGEKKLTIIKAFSNVTKMIPVNENLGIFNHSHFYLYNPQNNKIIYQYAYDKDQEIIEAAYYNNLLYICYKGGRLFEVDIINDATKESPIKIPEGTISFQFISDEEVVLIVEETRDLKITLKEEYEDYPECIFYIDPVEDEDSEVRYTYRRVNPADFEFIEEGYVSAFTPFNKIRILGNDENSLIDALIDIYGENWIDTEEGGKMVDLIHRRLEAYKMKKLRGSVIRQVRIFSRFEFESLKSLEVDMSIFYERNSKRKMGEYYLSFYDFSQDGSNDINLGDLKPQKIYLDDDKNIYFYDKQTVYVVY